MPRRLPGPRCWVALAFLFGLLAAVLAGAPRPGDAGSVSFSRGTLDFAISGPTSLTSGPDGRLYVASQSQIVALTLNATKQVVSTQTIASGQTGILGIAFDPTASPLTLYASRQDFAATDGYEGVVSRYTSPAWTRQDVITGLPSSAPASNHFTNGLAFDGQGHLFIAQGSNTDAGVPTGAAWPETPLSAAILFADVHALGFDGAVTYNPAGPPSGDNIDQTGGDVSVYAAGTRNSYDLVLHSNGYVYATDNGAPSNAPTSTTCSTSGTNASTSDELDLIEPGNYYGHPNRNRGRFDARQCTYHAPEEGSGAGFTGPIAVLPQHCSCDGMAEYTSDAFGGAMQGDLLIAEWGTGRVRRVQLSADGRSVASPITTLASAFGNPLDVTVGPDGTVYVAEYSGNQVSFLQPPGQDSDLDGCSDSREAQTAPGSQLTGGLRDPNYFWDFFDTPDNGNVRDRVVSVSDIGREVARFGSAGSTGIDPLSAAPPPPAYHTAFDRSPATGDPWDLGPPDGAVTVGDIGGVVVQFGHSCA